MGIRQMIRRSTLRPLAAAGRNLGAEFFFALTRPLARRRLRSLHGRTGLQVHLGCGDDIRPGWVNIDMKKKSWSRTDVVSGRDTLVIAYDLRAGLPLAPASCDVIYSSHFFEHLEYREGLKLMRDCHRALRPGGVFRLALPNFRGLFEAYLRNDRQYTELIDIFTVSPDLERGTETFVDHVNYGVYQNGEHRCIYDEDKVDIILRHIGFTSVSSSSYRAGIDSDDPVRRRYSFYVEAVK
jgi:predicted SAM-dependent methyltransferase